MASLMFQLFRSTFSDASVLKQNNNDTIFLQVVSTQKNNNPGKP